MRLKEQIAQLGKKAGALQPSNAAATSAIERNWRAWLYTLFGHIFTAPLASFHEEFWTWTWDALTAKRDGREFTDGNAFFSIWSRGFAKSTNAEIVPLAEAALLGSGFCLYVSGTQELANKHLASIEELLLSDTIREHYPQISSPKRGQTGLTKAWRQEFLRAESGYSIIAVGLDVGVRGVKIGTQRPSLIVLDDVDEREDSPAIAQKKLERLTHAILPTGGKQTLIICAQNLIHRHGVINRIYEGRVSALSHRRVSGPHKAVEDLRTERDGLRDVIVGGHPNWPYLGLRECQEFIDNSGLDAFLAEYQHDLKAAAQGLVIPEYDESVHLITWSEFARVYDRLCIPSDWFIEVGHDWGSTGFDKHPGVVSFIATSARNTKLPGVCFLFGALTFDAGILVDDAAGAIKQFLKPDVLRRHDYAKQVKRWRMSHEAKSERDTYRVKHGLPFQPCEASKTAGIAQLRHFMRVDYSKPNPFKPGVMGASGFYWIVADDQLRDPKDDRGLFRHRQEIIDWRWKPTPLTDAGMVKDEPVKFADDAMNSLMMVTQVWGPRSTPLTPAEQIEQKLPEHLRVEKAPAYDAGWARDAWEMSRSAAITKIKRGGAWDSDDPGLDDPWNPQSPLDRIRRPNYYGLDDDDEDFGTVDDCY